MIGTRQVFQLSIIFAATLFCAVTTVTAQTAVPSQPQEPAVPAVGNKTIALAQVLNQYEEAQLLFSLLAASPFSAERSPDELIAMVAAVSAETREALKRDWFVFLLGKFSLEEINQMRAWQNDSPKAHSLVLKILAQVGLSDTEMLGQLMVMVPTNVIRQQ
ncbi:MAG: hypothetical protein ACKVJU_19350 [Verrucomicrobiales bacterium]